MRHATGFRITLLAVLAALGAAVILNDAQGQMRGPRIPRIGPRPVGPKIVKVWTCTGCGKEIGRGLAFPPNTCPHCGARIINGVGNGIPQAGMGGSRSPVGPRRSPNSPPPAAGPTNPPPATNPNPNATPNPPAVAPPPPVENVPVSNPAPNPVSLSGGAGRPPTSSDSDGLARGVIIALIVGLVVVGGGIVAGGAWLMIHTMKNSDSERPRRRRRRSYEEEWDRA